MSTYRSIDPARWNIDGGFARGNRNEARILNEYLDGLKIKVYEAQKVLMDDNLPITATSLRNMVPGGKLLNSEPY